MDKKFFEVVSVGYDAGSNSSIPSEKRFRIWEFNLEGILIGLSDVDYTSNSIFHDKIRTYAQDGKTILFQMMKDVSVKGQSTRYLLVDDMKVVCLLRYDKDGYPDLVDFFDVTKPEQFKDLSDRLMNCGKEGYLLI